MNLAWQESLDMALFRQLYDRASRSFTYVVADAGSRTAIVIDPVPQGIELPLLGLIDELDLEISHLLCTHVHEGASGTITRLRQRTGARIVAGAGAPIHADVSVGQGDTVAFGGEAIRVLATPGHTATDVSYVWRDRVFSGDALLVRGCGATDLPGGDAGTLFDSITQRLLVLPGDTLLFPGHETHHRSVSTIAEERDYNPCVAGRSRDEFITQRCPR
jgi:glyoxylase-like metal-dependent hydrolase (beta-lactamase superfamily II)